MSDRPGTSVTRDELNAALELGAWIPLTVLIVLQPIVPGFDLTERCNAWVYGIMALTVLLAVARSRLTLPRSRITWPLLALWGVFACSVLFISGQAGERRELLVWTRYAAIFLVVATLVRSRLHARLALSAILATAVVVALNGMYQRWIALDLMREAFKAHPGLAQGWQEQFGWHARLYANEIFGTFILSNALAGYLVICVLVHLAFAWPVLSGRATLGKQTPRIRLLHGTILAVELGALYMTGSRGGYIALIIAGGVLALHLARETSPVRRRAWLLRWAGPVGVASVVIGLLLFAVTAATRQMLLSLAVRYGYWQGAWAMAWDNPWGVGLGRFGEHYAKYKALVGWETQEPHNIGFQVWTEAGVVGLLVLLWLAVQMLRQGAAPASWPADSNEMKHGATAETSRKLFVVCLIGGLLAFAIAYTRGINGLDSEKVWALFQVIAGKSYSGWHWKWTLAAIIQLALIPIWGLLFAALVRTGEAIDRDATPTFWRAGIHAAVVGFLVVGTVEFSLRSPGLMSTLMALLGLSAAGEGRGRLALPEPRNWSGAGLRLAGCATAAVLVYAGSVQISRLADSRELVEDLRQDRAQLRKKQLRLQRDPSVSEKQRREKTRELLKQEAALTEAICREVENRIAIVPDDHDAHSDLVSPLVDLKRLGVRSYDGQPIRERIEDALDESVRLAPARSPYHLNLGHHYLVAAHPDALEHYQRAAELYPNKPALWLYYGDALVLFGDLKKAKTMYARAQELDQQVDDERAFLSLIFRLRGSFRPTPTGDPSTRIVNALCAAANIPDVILPGGKKPNSIDPVLAFRLAHLYAALAVNAHIFREPRDREEVRKRVVPAAELYARSAGRDVHSLMFLGDALHWRAERTLGVIRGNRKKLAEMPGGPESQKAKLLREISVWEQSATDDLQRATKAWEETLNAPRHPPRGSRGIVVQRHLQAARRALAWLTKR